MEQVSLSLRSNQNAVGSDGSFPVCPLLFMQLSTLLLMSRSAVDRQVSDFPPFFSYVPKLPTRTGYARCSTIVITREQFTVSLPVHIFSHLCFYLSLRQLVIPNSLSHFPPQKKTKKNSSVPLAFFFPDIKKKDKVTEMCYVFYQQQQQQKMGVGDFEQSCWCICCLSLARTEMYAFFSPPVSGIPR